MFLIHLHTAHQNLVLKELFGVQERLWNLFYETFNSFVSSSPHLEPGSWDLPRVNRIKLQGWLWPQSDPVWSASAMGSWLWRPQQTALCPFYGAREVGTTPPGSPRDTAFGLNFSLSLRCPAASTGQLPSAASFLWPVNREQVESCGWNRSSDKSLRASPSLCPLTGH